MWLPDLPIRLAPAVALFAGMVALAGCGFQPVYGTQGAGYAAQEVTAAIEIAPIKDRVGQRIRNQLIRQLTPDGEPVDAPYLMRLQVSVSERNVFTRVDREVDRASVMVTVAYKVFDAATLNSTDPEKPPVVIYADKAFAESSFNRFSSDPTTGVGSEFSNVRARIDAENRAASEVAIMMRNQIVAAVVAGAS